MKKNDEDMATSYKTTTSSILQHCELLKNNQVQTAVIQSTHEPVSTCMYCQAYGGLYLFHARDPGGDGPNVCGIWLIGYQGQVRHAQLDITL
jgi:hypothetical protein